MDLVAKDVAALVVSEVGQGDLMVPGATLDLEVHIGMVLEAALEVHVGKVDLVSPPHMVDQVNRVEKVVAEIEKRLLSSWIRFVKVVS